MPLAFHAGRWLNPEAIERGDAVVHEDLIKILVCPETHQPVKPAPAAVLAALKERVRRGTLKDKGGEPVERELEEGLVREDGRIVYPVIDGIPRMLVERGIPVEAQGAAGDETAQGAAQGAKP
jgi:uncharacterized protein YbaR (Trm112 family)